MQEGQGGRGRPDPPAPHDSHLIYQFSLVHSLLVDEINFPISYIVRVTDRIRRPGTHAAGISADPSADRGAHCRPWTPASPSPFRLLEIHENGASLCLHPGSCAFAQPRDEYAKSEGELIDWMRMLAIIASEGSRFHIAKGGAGRWCTNAATGFCVGARGKAYLP